MSIFRFLLPSCVEIAVLLDLLNQEKKLARK